MHGDYRFDLGGHRFFAKIAPVKKLWETIIGDDFLLCPRLSRIYFLGRFFADPLEAKDVLSRLGLRESVLCALSYFWSRLNRARAKEETFEDWIEAHFGRRLYRAFFGPYTEKVLGDPGVGDPRRVAAQRIKDFSFTKAVLNILGLQRKHVTTLNEKFHYPRLGPGQMWEAFQTRVEASGIPVCLEHRCTAIHHDAGRVTAIVVDRARRPGKVIDGTKVQVPRAYPMYDGDYRDAVLTLHGFISGFENLKTFSRNGLHRYNNQDHSMWTAILATLNQLDGTEYDVWSVNADGEYHEDGELVDQLLHFDLARP